MRPAPTTFDTKRSADRWLVEREYEMSREGWSDSDAAKISLGEYAGKWVKERELKTRTREEYERHLRLHIVPQLGILRLPEVTAQVVRTWRTKLVSAGVGRSAISKSYRILHAIFNTALDDELIRRNPCRIRGASQDKAPERPTATLDQVFAIAAAIQPRYRLLVLLAAFAQLRFGELIGLRRSHLDLETMEVRVVKATGEREDGTQEDDDPKSEAGKRTTSIPEALRTDIELHLALFAQPGPTGRLFVGPTGAIPRRRNFNRIWKAALRSAGIPPELGLHLHDLRHTGSTWSAQTGATLREVMARIGHSSTRAAMIYQHATRERDRAIAEALNDLIDGARGQR
jgi:integrase